MAVRANRAIKYLLHIFSKEKILWTTLTAALIIKFNELVLLFVNRLTIYLFMYV